jgi:hypothetical protein
MQIMDNQERISASRRMSLSAAKLNNRGVVQLESGDYKGAAETFTISSNTMIQVIAVISVESQQRGACLPTGATSSNDTSSAPARKRQSPDDEESEQQQEHEMTVSSTTPTVVLDKVEPSPKRAKAGHVDIDKVTVPRRCHQKKPPTILARPLLIRRHMSATSQSAVILYNLAMSLQMVANNAAREDDKVRLLEQALELYNMTRLMSLKSNGREMLESPVLFVTMHNMLQIQRQLGKCVKGLQSLQASWLQKLLRVCPEQYELFYLQLLSTSDSHTTAPVA